MYNEKSTIYESLAVEARDSTGRIKSARYIKEVNGVKTEFIPNRFYLYLLNRGVIKGDTYKIPLLLGRQRKEK